MALMGDKAPSGSARRWLCSEQITPYKGEEKWRGGGRVGEGRGGGGGSPDFTEPNPNQTLSDDQGKGFEK